MTHFLGCGMELADAYDSRLNTCDHFTVSSNSYSNGFARDINLK